MKIIAPLNVIFVAKHLSLLKLEMNMSEILINLWLVIFVTKQLVIIGNWENTKFSFIKKLKDVIFVNCAQRVFFSQHKLFSNIVPLNMVMNLNEKVCQKICDNFCDKVTIVTNLWKSYDISQIVYHYDIHACDESSTTYRIDNN